MDLNTARTEAQKNAQSWGISLSVVKISATEYSYKRTSELNASDGYVQEYDVSGKEIIPPLVKPKWWRKLWPW